MTDYDDWRKDVLKHANQRLYSVAPQQASRFARKARGMNLIEMWHLVGDEDDYHSLKHHGTMVAEHVLGAPVTLVVFETGMPAYAGPREQKGLKGKAPGTRTTWQWFAEEYPVMVVGPGFCE